MGAINRNDVSLGKGSAGPSDSYSSTRERSSIAKRAIHSILQGPYQIVENRPLSGWKEELGRHSSDYAVVQFLRNIVDNDLG
jgi:hypothetical protein